jgi:hypothetical protein
MSMKILFLDGGPMNMIPGWFNNLNKVMVIRFIRELHDIWSYRAQLSPQQKRDISPPVGNPFGSLNMYRLPDFPYLQLRRIALEIMETMTHCGNNPKDVAGLRLILCALTLASPEAAAGMPLIYDLVAPPT